MQCRKKKKGGGQCRAQALRGKDCCAMHGEPGRAAVLGSRGGRRRAVYKPEDLKEFPAPKNAADLRDLLAESIIEIRTGKMDPKMANALGYIGASYLRAVEVSELEVQLKNLQSLVDAQPEPGK